MTTCQHRNTQYDRSVCYWCGAPYDFCLDCGADVTRHKCKGSLEWEATWTTLRWCASLVVGLRGLARRGLPWHA